MRVLIWSADRVCLRGREVGVLILWGQEGELQVVAVQTWGVGE